MRAIWALGLARLAKACGAFSSIFLLPNELFDEGFRVGLSLVLDAPVVARDLDSAGQNRVIGKLGPFRLLAGRNIFRVPSRKTLKPEF